MISILLAAALSASIPADELPRRAWLGFAPAGGADGPVIASVVPDGPAARAGVEAGDGLRTVAGVSISSGQSLQAALRSAEAGAPVEVGLVRDGAAVTVSVVPAPAPPPEMTGARVELGQVTLADGSRARTVTLSPEDSGLATDGAAPGVFFIQGIPCASIENLENPEHYRVRLFQRLVDAGFAVGFADKPGVGDSEGAPCLEGGFDREIEAFRLAAQALADREDVDEARVYAVGVSMGGIQAPLVAETVDLAGIVTWGTGVQPWYEYIVTNFRTRVILQNQPAADAEPVLRNMRSVLAKLLIEGRSPDEIREAHPDAASLFETSWGDLTTFAGRHYTFHQELDAASVWAAWQGFDGDVLAVHGEHDLIASFHDHALAPEIVQRNADVDAEILVLPGLDHAMTRHDSQAESFANAFQGERDDSFHDAALNWLLERARR